MLASGAGYLQTLGYLTASDAALANPQKAAALQDFIKRFYKASAILRKDPLLAAADLREDVRRHAASRQGGRRVGRRPSARRSRRPSSATSRRRPTPSRSSGLLPSTLNVKSIFDLPYNKIVAKNSNLHVVTVQVAGKPLSGHARSHGSG